MRQSLVRIGSVVVASASLLTSACVTKSTHEALQKDFAETRQRMQGEMDKQRKDAEAQQKSDEEKRQALQQQLTDAQAQLDARDRKIAELQSSLEAERQKGQDQGKRIAKLEADLAAGLKDKSTLAANVEQMKNALAELGKRKAEADARLAEFRSLIGRFQKLIDAGKLRVKTVEGRMVVELATDVLFAPGSATLSKDGKAAIAEVATVLSSIPDRHFQVEGHTDSSPISTAQYPSNWELGAARAITVVKTMIDNGMPSARISGASYGDSRPARPNDSAEGKAANRRIEIVVVPDLSSLPGFDELNRAASASAQ